MTILHIVPMLSLPINPALFYSFTSHYSWWIGRSTRACFRRPWLAPKPRGAWQKSSAALLSVEPSAFLARIYAPMSQATVDVISDIQGHYYGDQAAGVEDTGWYRAGLKRKAADISRTQYEVYSFSTKHNLSEAAVDELLEMLSNVCTSFDQSSSL